MLFVVFVCLFLPHFLLLYSSFSLLPSNLLFRRSYTLCSRPLTHHDLADLFAKELGRPIKYVQVPYEDAKKAFMSKGIAEWQVDGMLELYRLIDKDQYVFDEHTMEQVTGEKPMTAEQWVDSVGTSFVWDTAKANVYNNVQWWIIVCLLFSLIQTKLPHKSRTESNNERLVRIRQSSFSTRDTSPFWCYMRRGFLLY